MFTSVSLPPTRTAGRWRGLRTAFAAVLMLMPAAVTAAPSVNWTSPANNSSYVVGTNVTPVGVASGFDTPGTGLDLALVLDASGSMGANATAGGVTKTRAQWQADAAIALVNSLPSGSTAVAVIEYGTVAGTSVVLPLTPTTDAAAIVAALNSVTATQPQTAIGAGINLARAELMGPNGTPGAVKQMVVISDGANNAGVNPVAAAGAAFTEDGIIVHGVVIPGGSSTQMQNIANAGGGSFADFSDPNNLANIEAFFGGTGGSFVGVSNVEVVMPDGSVVANALTDAFGNFSVNWDIQLGNNLFTANATFQDGSMLSTDLNLIGTAPNGTGVIPLPASVWLMLSGLGALYGLRRRRLG
ncbi:MAG: VWA domain-containing protein [Alkalilacustris sp.]